MARTKHDTIPPRPRECQPVPSPAQQRLWFLSQLEGMNAVYNVVSVYRLVGLLDENALRQALRDLVRRHDSLRLTFPTREGAPRMVKGAEYDPLTVEPNTPPEKSGGPGNAAPAVPDEATARWVNRNAGTPFDLAEGPLFRVHLLNRNDKDHVLVVNIHHIISDAWSMEILVRDICLLYNAYAAGRVPSLDPPSAGYLDYAAWKQDRLGQADHLRRYWMEKLAGAPSLLEMPTDFPRPARMRYRGRRQVQSFPKELTARIKGLGRKLGATDFMVLFSAFVLLLHRYTGQSDLVVGTPIANRTHRQTEQMVGLLANTLALRTRIDGDMTFSQLVDRVKKVALDAYEHQEFPFETLVETLNPARSMSHSPIYQVMFMHQNVPEQALKLTGLDMAPMAPEHTTARLDLTLEIVENHEGFLCGWEFNTDLFRPETITRMTGHLRMLLEGALARPDSPVGRLPILTAEESRQWESWNATGHDYPREKTLVDLFEHQAGVTPDNTAIVFRDRSVTFRELNRAANGLARHLTAQGVKSGTLVGICADRSVDMVTGLLGILKAGGAYVPLDPDYPIARIQDIIADAGFQVMVSQAHLLERFSSLPDTVVCLDRLPENALPTEAHDPNPARLSRSENLAYVIYTSGSTGKPKGVMIGHRALVNFLTGMQRLIRFAPEDRLLALTTISFDIAALELFLPLITGGRMVMVSRDTAADPARLVRTMSGNEITHMQATPATWKMLVQHGWRQKTPLTILTGGEALPASLGKTLVKNSRKLWNVYGPTETTIWSSIHDATLFPETPELIGTPIANTQIYILDANLQPVPAGVPGELCIGGHGLAMGYMNRPNLTADRFVTIALFGSRRRIYRTGDLARLRFDGNLEYLGRFDHQIKLRGFRIELAEIEVVLSRHEQVKEAVVILDTTDNPMLVAYVIPQTPMSDANGILRPWLKERLPEYMIPSVFMILEDFPLTPNGKIDRKSLPAPRHRAQTAAGIPPRTPVEKRLVDIWCNVLNQTDIGIFDNFFELGGDSILSVRIVSRARQDGLALVARDLFLHQTVAELAAAAVAQNREEIPPASADQEDAVPSPRPDPQESPGMPPNTPTPVLPELPPETQGLLHQRYHGNVQDAYPLSPMQEGMLFHGLKTPETGLYLQQFHCRLEGPLDTSAFRAAWQALVDRHDVLRTAFCHDLSTPLQVVMKSAALSWQTLDWQGLSPEESAHRLAAELTARQRKGFDLTRAPLMQVQLIREAPEAFRLVWHHHHLLMDGWSFPILFSELLQIYQALREKQALSLPHVPPYRDYIAWVTSRDTMTARAHWQNHLDGVSAPTPLTFGKPERESASPADFGEVTHAMDPGLDHKLRRFGRENRLTLNTLIQGAWAGLLSRYTGGLSTPVVFGVVTSGREVPIPGIDRMIGLFINTLPLRVAVDDGSVRKVLQTVQKDQQQNNLFAASALGEIQKWSNVPGGTPLFDTLVVFENYPLNPKMETSQKNEGGSEDPGNTCTLKFSDFGGEERTNYPLNLAVLPEDVLKFRLTFDSRRFDRESMERLLVHLVQLLESMLRFPEKPFSRLPLLTEAEEERISTWNRTRKDYPRGRTVADLIRMQANRRPEGIAVEFGREKLTYGQLNRQSDRLAAYLSGLGVTTETLVGICLDRSPDLVVGMLGILKAGGAYVPMDPDYPSARLKLMLEDSAAPVLITRSPLLDKFLETGAQIVCMDNDRVKIETAEPCPPASAWGPSNLAYVIYTSGSTGRPKGVMVEHGGLANLIHWHIRNFSITPADRASMLASPAFDALCAELWPYLCQGATVVPMPRDILRAQPEAFKTWMESHGISVAFIPPALLEPLMEGGWKEGDLKHVLTGGDVLHSHLTPNCRFRLWNNYGPTEATVLATSGEIFAVTHKSGDLLPSIGRPIDNTRVYILPPHAGTGALEPVPPGLAGELCIAGDGLARGYLNRPDLTAEKFIDTTISGRRQRVYRTGDAARFNPDGSIQYLGRLDHQVSLRGYRIELQEIETHLRSHGCVKDAVVILREDKKDASGRKYLAAYITLAPDNGEPRFRTGELARWMTSRLPGHMIPSRFTVLDRLPVTPNGKIDRNALPATDPCHQAGAFEAPRTDTEQRLLEVWQQVLAVRDVGIHDNFFEIGGDSILSIRIVAAARTRGMALGPGDLFRHQTVAELARVVKTVPAPARADRAPSAGEVCLSPVQHRFFSTRRSKPWHYNQSILLKVPVSIDGTALKMAFRQLLSHHDALRLRFQKNAAGWTSTYGEIDVLPWQEEDLGPDGPDPDDPTTGCLSLAEKIRLRAGFWQASLNLEKGPLVRMVLFRTAKEARLLWCIHHLVVDGVSWRILIEDLRQAYAQAANGHPISLPDKTCTYQVWTQQMTSWQVTSPEYFRSLPASKPLPVDFEPAAPRAGAPGFHTISFSKETTHRLMTRAPAAFGARINDVLLTALIQTLEAWTGDEGWLIDTESHGRTDLFPSVDISRTVGWFTALYTLFLKVPPACDPGTALKSVKEQLRQVPDDGVGYCVLRWLYREDLPQAQILFNYLGQFTEFSDDSSWEPASEDIGPDAHPQMTPDYPIEINGRILNGRLSLTWGYDAQSYRKETIEQLSDRYRHHLEQLVTLCDTTFGYTPSDFPLAGLPQAALDRLALQHGDTIDDIYPLTPMQAGMLFHTLSDPGNTAYFEQFHGRLKGRIDPGHFKASWQRIVRRHPILRTGFHHHTDTPLQLVFKSAEIPIEVLDWQHMAPPEKEKQLERLLTSERNRGFDLETAPLMRIHLILEGHDSCRLVLHHHHLLLDGWCLPILFAEWQDTYQALSRRQPPVLPQVPPFREYIRWLGEQDPESAARHWQSYLSGVTSPTVLPHDPDAPGGKGHAVLTKDFDPDLSQTLMAFSRRHRLTLSTLFQGAWAGLLSRYTREGEVVFGVTGSGRQAPVEGIERMVGLFINTLPVRVDTQKGTVRDVLNRIQDNHQQNSPFAHTALSDIQQLSRVPNGTPLFETIMVFENYPMDTVDGTHPPLTPEDREKQEAIRFQGFTGIEYTHYPLSLAVMPSDGIFVRLTFDRERFSPVFAEDLLRRLEVLLAGMAAAGPDRPFARLPLLDGADQQRLAQWNQTRAACPEDRTVVDLFEAQAAATPDNTAVVFDGTTLDYNELNRAANRMARFLSARGVGRETLVGICLERSAEMVIALLGVLKAGGAYVPIDPGYPGERIRYMLEDAGVSLLLTHSLLDRHLPRIPGQKRIRIDQIEAALKTESHENLPPQSSPHGLAYTIYTSGSTGRPKGVSVAHGALMNHMHWMQKTFEFTADDRFLQKTPFSFDPSVWEFYAPLTIGAALVMAKPYGHKDPDYLLETIREQCITVLRVVPSLLKMLVDAGTCGQATSLRYLLCGGETLSPDLIKAVYNWLPDTRLYNLYGPTEATIVASAGYCPPGCRRVSIGRPIDNTRIYILDHTLNPLPPGIPGELCIAGNCLAQGYINRPDLTNERFVQADISGRTERLYKTGDLARFTTEGNLEYLGRMDHQVKLRGMRIELSEIEWVLTRHENVKEAVAVLHDADSPCLAAYVTLNTPQKEVTTALRTWLKKQLPEFMVPLTITELDALPLAPNGKVNRSALPAPDRPLSSATFAAPRTDRETRLLGIWQEILGQPDLGIHDNFFEQGGDSILSIRIVAKSREQGMGFTPRDLFESQTVATLAQKVRPLSPRTFCPQGPVTGEVPLTPIQKRFFSRSLDEPWHFNQAVLLTLPDDIDVPALTYAFNAILAHHDALRLRFRNNEGQWSGWSGPPSKEPPPFHVEDLSQNPSPAAQDTAMAERAGFWQSRFDLEKGPLTRMVLFKMGDRSRLLWCIHHLVVDGVSWRILLEDLPAAYAEAAAGRDIRLPEKTSAYRSWAQRMASWKDDRAFSDSCGYWRRLHGASPLPLDHPEGSNTLADTREHTFRLSPETTRLMLTESHRTYRTRINDLLLTALALTLREWTFDLTCRIDLEGHGRHHLFDDLDLSRTVGWFTAIHPVSLSLPRESGLGTALKQIKEQLRQVPRNGIGYGVARWLKNEPLSGSDILFNYMGRFQQGPQGSPWSPADEDTGPSMSLKGDRSYILEINSQTMGNRFTMTWGYSRNMFRPGTIRHLADRYRHFLEKLVDHCVQAWEAGTCGHTPSDFPLVSGHTDTSTAGRSPATQRHLDRLSQKYKTNIEDLYPLAPIQEGMLFHSLDAPGQGVYIEQRHCLFKGTLDIDAFRRAWQFIVDRHTILRTAVCQDLPRPLQLVQKTAVMPWQELDWREPDSGDGDKGDRPHTSNRQKLEALLDAERSKGFDLGCAPLMRIQMIRESDSAWRMVWHHHHLLMDGWSLPVLFSELFEAYQAISAGAPPVLPRPTPYRDYIDWLNRQDRHGAKSYWQEYLKGVTTPTPLPLGRFSRKPADFRDLYLDLPADLNRRLNRFSRTHRLTLNTLIQGAWAAILGRYTGEETVVFGVTTSGRQAPVEGIDRMIGIFINTLPLRVNLEDIPVLDLFRAIQADQQNNNHFAHTALPDIQQWSDIPRGTPLFETILVFENYPVDDALRGNSPSSALEIADASGVEFTNYPITLAVVPESASIRVKLSFDRHRFPQGGMEGMLDHFERLLSEMINQPESACFRLPMLSRREQEQMLTWNRTGTSRAKNRVKGRAPTIVDMFESHAARAPDRIALVHENRRISYGSLNEETNRLARHLMASGVGKDTLVGVCMDRSADMITAILGILKAGGAYLPLDPSYPASRLAFMLEDAGVETVITQSHLISLLPSPGSNPSPATSSFGAAPRIVCTDRDTEEIARRSGQNPALQSDPDNLAYVIYTSGSTGQPKGCQITHANVTRLFSATDSRFGFTPDDVWTLFHSFAFDFSVWEIFGALLYGGRLVIPSFDVTRTPEAFYELLITQKVTVLNQTPSAFNQLTRVDETPSDLSLRLVIFGGEALDFGVLNDWYNRHDPMKPQMVNMYGITETTVHVTYYPLSPEDSSRRNRIGAPISDLEAWVLDQHRQPVPVGVPGELYVAGAGLARGYLNRPELTAQRFMEIDIFNRKKRMYRTGDMVRRTQDGNLEYIGRMDHQVKLRGFRIELPEIESALKRHNDIDDAVVVLYNRNNTQGLAAYVICAGACDSGHLTTELRRWLATTLPDYMIPGSIVILDHLPLTPNGKIDRKALPEPETQKVSRAYAPPRTRTERHLVSIWQKVLNHPNIGIFDNFFELGGDSILSIQIVSRARNRGLGLTPRDIFEYQTIAALSDAARPLVENASAEQGPVSGDMPLSPIQQRFFTAARKRPGHFNQSVLLSVSADLLAAAMEKALERVVLRHDALRLTFARRNGEWTGSYDKNSDLPWHMEDLSQIPSRVEQDLFMGERAAYWQTRLDIENGPLMQMVLFRMGDRARLFWCIHHLAVDGVSWRILLRDLHTAYHQAASGIPVSLPDKTDSFKRWAGQLHQWKKKVPQALMGPDCWQSPAEAVPLPMDHPDGANRLMDERRHTVRLTPDKTRRLLTRATLAYRTQINDHLLTALMLTLKEWTGRDRVLIDLEGHGRADLSGIMDNPPDLSETVGWFTSLYPLELKIPKTAEKAADPGAALKKVKEQLRQVPHQGIGYGIRRWLNSEALPQGQILFNYLGQLDPMLSDSQWTFAPEETGLPADPSENRDYPIEINGRTQDGCLSLTFTYSGRQYDPSTIERLGGCYRTHLNNLITHCEQGAGYTPSDFPLAGLGQDQLDGLADIYSRQIEDMYPLAPMQEGMLFHSLRDPDEGMYFEQVHCRLTGDLDAGAFQRAWQHLVNRHAVLRTVFRHDLDAPPLQLVMKEAQLAFRLLDWQRKSAEERHRCLDRLLSDERSRGFDLATGPLMRIQLIREDRKSWRMVWHHHHILLDGWSLPILFRELFEAYDAFRGNRMPQPEPALPYKSFISWLTRQDRSTTTTHWQAYLSGFRTPTPLPWGTQAPYSGGFRELALEIDSRLTKKLTDFSRTRRLTLNTLVQWAWAALLGRCSGESDVVFGVTTSGRQTDVPGIEQMVGLFINTQPLRVNLSKGPVMEVLQSIQAEHLANDEHSHIPLSDIQNLSEVPNGTALFETILVFENYPLDQDGNTLPETLRADDVTGIEYTNYPLTLAVIPGKTLGFKLTFDTRRYGDKDAKSLLNRLFHLMETLVANPDKTALQLPLATAAEISAIESWNHTNSRHPENKTVIDLFEDQVKKTPENTAVVCGDQAVTYRALNSKANRLARYLRRKGIGPDVLAGILMDRSIEMVVALLGTLKAGGAYLPLDPGSPLSRLAFIIEDAGLQVLLTDDTHAEDLGLPDDILVISTKCLGKSSEQVPGDQTHESSGNPDRSVGFQNLAYTIYTSGSTGRPKGVMIEHGALLNHMLWMKKTFAFSKKDKFFQKTPFGFDASVWEFYAPLLSGSTLVMADPGGHLDPGYMLKTIHQQGITILQLVPTALKMMTETGELRKAASLRCLFCGGEPLTADLAQTFFKECPDTQLFNLYGPTEATIDTTFFRLKPDTSDTAIGRPIDNARVYVLDENQNPLPPGVPGELCIAGIGLARGYRNNPELSAAHFVETDIWGAPQRVYKTGDLALWRLDGTLAFMGRLDHQVKLNGFRIEPAEIESVLRKHEAVTDAAVVMHNGETGARLSGYVILKKDMPTRGLSDPIQSSLKAWAGKFLPGYMVPADITPLETFPLTSSGKVDRNSLPAPAPGPYSDGFLAPRNQRELKLVQIWEDLLGIAHIGIRDNFFELGGHSILAVRLASQISQAFKTDVPISSLFQGPTIEAMARSLAPDTISETKWSPIVTINGKGHHPPLFCVHPAGGTVFCYWELAQHLGKNQPVYGIQSRGIEPGAAPLCRIEDMAARYIEGIRSIQPRGPYQLAGWSLGGQVAFEMACLLQSQGESVSLLAVLDAFMRIPNEAPPAMPDDAQLIHELLTEQGIPLSLDMLRELKADKQLCYIRDKGRQTGYFPADISIDQLRRYFGVYKANLNASQAYTPDHRFQGKIILFKAQDPLTNLKRKPDLGWSAYASEGAKIIPAEGHHHNMAQAPHVKKLSEKLSSYLLQPENIRITDKGH